MINFFEGLFKKKKKRTVVVLSLEKIKMAAMVLVLIGIYALVHAIGFDMYLDCDKQTKMCTISKKSTFEPTAIKLGRFDTSRIYEIKVDSRKLESGKLIYDILVDYGTKTGGEAVFIDYAFESQIKANTLMMRLTNYLETNAPELHFKKRCYFSEYFCF